METIELIYVIMLAGVAVLITWFAGYVVYKLYQGQR